VPNNKTDCVAVGSSLNDKALLGGILIFTALLYLPTLNYHFVYDDQGQIVDNALVRAWRFVPEYFQSHVWQYLYPNALGNYYRPLNVLWFRINDALFGLKPMGWHASAVLLHLLATALRLRRCYLAYTPLVMRSWPGCPAPQSRFWLSCSSVDFSPTWRRGNAGRLSG